ncbi:peptide ABC transporter substrate-binding protein [Pediococcus ethanolidurans]|uniref:peptide ABC transporter substrate-binding protein n=1 Tax=Pediococcus ethanolidurans TaxID=319653 RepID=UPI0021E8F365|nr:peptide ABC transporter substrate-binding protein [Pediococcus ethanolidurans]MCV3554738.1 peptide ABC transporter substrate-binding protein [Pediococcus ethanolidurans]
MKNKWKKLGTATLLLSVLLAGCGSAKSSEAKHQSFSVMEQSDLLTTDSSQITDLTSFNMVNNTEEGLYRVAKGNKPVAALAEKVVKPTNNGKTYTFKLRKGLKWSNGDALTAQDFVYSWRRTVNPKTKAGYAYIMQNVKNASAISAGKMKPNKLGVKALNKRTLRVTLTHATPYFKYLMAFGTFFPQNKKAVEKYGSKYGTASKYMVYSGPFKMVGWTGTNMSWKLVKNNQYWDKKNVAVSKIPVKVVKDPNTALNLYQSGKLDDALLSGEQASQEKSNKAFVKYEQGQTAYLAMSFKKGKATANVNVRKAISLVVNRKTLTSKVLADGSTPATGFMPTSFVKNSKTGTDFTKDANVSEAVEYNVAKAKKYWQKGLKQTGKTKVNFELVVSDDDAQKKVAEAVQSTVEQNLPGATVTVRSLPTKGAQSAQLGGKFDMTVVRWIGDYTDPLTFAQLETTGNTYNHGSFSNKTYDKLVAATNGKDANNEQKRYEDFVKAEKLLMQQEAVVPLYQAVQTQLVNTKAKGIVYHPTGAPYDYKWAHVEK